MRDWIDSLEPRQLFAGGPVVTDFKISPRSPIATTGSLVFTVRYADTQGVNALSFDNRDIRIAGPNGFARYATAAGSSSNGDGTVRSVRYKIAPPRGRWDSADNGTYTVRLHGDQVFDILNNASDSQLLGRFGVNIAVRGVAPAPRAMQLAVNRPTAAPKLTDILD
ncbi:MAG: hypothetical protein H7Z14_19400 [Anaerolineae bacterium]|nr:hypothetical protein [Phycisphaerae bacterium]